MLRTFGQLRTSSRILLSDKQNFSPVFSSLATCHHPFSNATNSKTEAKRMRDIQQLAEGIQAGNRRSLSKAITLVESTTAHHRADSAKLLLQLQRSKQSSSSSSSSLSTSYASSITGVNKDKDNQENNEAEKAQFKMTSTYRLGLSGAPGVGKSTFIESFGMFLIEKGLKVAVLSIDPSSSRTGGSILGDKTRMELLTRHPNSFIRPSPSSGVLGGVGRATAETVMLCEAAGYDVVIVETVGVGQSEVQITDTCDMVALLVGPTMGDELQGIKKGIVEVADMVIVNKADGALMATARHTKSDYRRALELQNRRHPGWDPKCLLCSSVGATPEQKEARREYLDGVWKMIQKFYQTVTATSQQGEEYLNLYRSKQSEKWMWEMVKLELEKRITESSEVATEMNTMRSALRSGKQTSRTAAMRLVDLFLSK